MFWFRSFGRYGRGGSPEVGSKGRLVQNTKILQNSRKCDSRANVKVLLYLCQCKKAQFIQWLAGKTLKSSLSGTPSGYSTGS
jgi:hypothetical protein